MNADAERSRSFWVRTATLEDAEALDRDRLSATLGYAARAAAITCSRRGADLPRAAELTD